MYFRLSFFLVLVKMRTHVHLNTCHAFSAGTKCESRHNAVIELILVHLYLCCFHDLIL